MKPVKVFPFCGHNQMPGFTWGVEKLKPSLSPSLSGIEKLVNVQWTQCSCIKNSWFFGCRKTKTLGFFGACPNIQHLNLLLVCSF